MSPTLSSKLVVDGEVFFLENSPLSSVAEVSPSNVKCWRVLPEEELRDLFDNGPSFLWDCISYWELRGGRLYLANVLGFCQMTKKGPQFAWWYSGDLVARDGKVIERGCVKNQYERHLIFHFSQGVFIGTTMRHNSIEPEAKPPPLRRRWDRIGLALGAAAALAGWLLFL